MKTRIFPKLMPAFVFALGVVGAFVTMSMDVKDSDPELRNGWAKDELDRPCQLMQPCQTSGGVICTHAVTGDIAYDKTGPTTCPSALFKVGS